MATSSSGVIRVVKASGMGIAADTGRRANSGMKRVSSGGFGPFGRASGGYNQHNRIWIFRVIFAGRVVKMPREKFPATTNNNPILEREA